MKIRKITSILFGVIICFAMVTNSQASPGEITVNVNKQEVFFPDEKPYIDENNRTLVPIRFVAEELDSDVSWNGERRDVTIKRGQSIILLKIGADTLFLGGTYIKDGVLNTLKENVYRNYQMDTAPIIKNGRIFIPVRFVAEAFGAEVGWVGVDSLVTVDTSKVDSFEESNYYDEGNKIFTGVPVGFTELQSPGIKGDPFEFDENDEVKNYSMELDFTGSTSNVYFSKKPDGMGSGYLYFLLRDVKRNENQLFNQFKYTVKATDDEITSGKYENITVICPKTIEFRGTTLLGPELDTYPVMVYDETNIYLFAFLNNPEDKNKKDFAKNDILRVINSLKIKDTKINFVSEKIEKEVDNEIDEMTTIKEINFTNEDNKE